MQYSVTYNPNAMSGHFDTSTVTGNAESVEIQFQEKQLTVVESGVTHVLKFHQLKSFVVEPEPRTPVNGQQAQDNVDRLIFNSAGMPLEEE